MCQQLTLTCSLCACLETDGEAAWAEIEKRIRRPATAPRQQGESISPHQYTCSTAFARFLVLGVEAAYDLELAETEDIKAIKKELQDLKDEVRSGILGIGS